MNQAIIDSKKAVVSEIAQKMKESQSTVVVEYRGLSVAEVTELRRNLREEGVELRFTKTHWLSVLLLKQVRMILQRI